MKNLAVILLCLFFAAGPPSVYSQEQESRELFSKAYALFAEGNLAQAEDLFQKTLDSNFLLEDYSLYFSGAIAVSRGELESGRAHFAKLKQQFPLSTWVAHAELHLAKISLAENKNDQALGELRALTNRSLKKEIAEETLFLTARTHEALGELKQAYSRYQELRRTSPLSPWAARARNEIKRLRGKHPELFRLGRVDALAEEAELLSREREYAEAEKGYRQILDQVPKGPLRPYFLMRLANVYRSARKREEAIPVLSEIFKAHSSSSQAPAALYRLAESYWNRDENVKALDHFKQLRDRYPQSFFNDLAHLASARIYESLGRQWDALRLYRDFSKRFPDSPMREEAQWRLAWLHYLQADYKRAYSALNRLVADKVDGRYKAAALYWQARSAQKMGLSEEAKQLFSQILNAREDSYYKGPAAKWLETMGAAVEEKKRASSILFPEALPPLSPDRSFHLSRARELAEISLNQLAVAELDEVRNSGDDDLPLKLTLMREYARNSAYARSVALANQIPLTSDELNRYRYPLAFWETIQKITEVRALDPYLVVALIRQESIFDPKALSPASAFGLMQLLPSTAARAAEQLGVPPPQREELFEPDINLTLGTHYLRELLQRYSNNLVKAIAAYNAGENAVARWEKQITAEDEDEFIERIPYRETRLYVKLVLRNHRIYRKIYDTRNEKTSSD
ncbi:MAG: transglycosylase SLT domain-containing protein [Deltaproteobacteria bacterium]|nr:transglycosylase SLT domain-containing protein [Deltaproteobacteria bacterium]